MPEPQDIEPDYEELLRRLRDGMIVPFFGAGASVSCGLPSGGALTTKLVLAGKYPEPGPSVNLALAASYFVAREGGDTVALNGLLRKSLVINDAKPGPIHQLLAQTVFNELRLYVTTNYDNLVERALEQQNRSPWVIVDRGSAGKVWCRRPGKSMWEEVESKNLRYTIKESKNPIVLKLHGSVHEEEHRAEEYYLITEENYVDFLGRPEGGQLPQMLAAHMRPRSFLFLGYGLKDWNIRVMLRKLAETRARNRVRSWAIVLRPTPADRTLWQAQDVTLHSIDLADLARKLSETLAAQDEAGAST